jgi:hypothetical protein
MTVMTSAPLLPAILPPLPVRRFTVDEYHRLIETGVLREDDDVELLEDLGPIDAQELLP